MRGHEATEQQKRRIWAMCEAGECQMHEMHRVTGLSIATVREILLEGCARYMQRLRSDRAAEAIDELIDR